MRVCSPCPRSSQSGGVSLMPDETIAVDARSLVHGVACGTASSFGNVVFAHASYAQKDVVSMISVDKRRELYWHPRHIVTCEAHARECASGISPGLTTLFFPEKAYAPSIQSIHCRPSRRLYVATRSAALPHGILGKHRRSGYLGGASSAKCASQVYAIAQGINPVITINDQHEVLACAPMRFATQNYAMHAHLGNKNGQRPRRTQTLVRAGARHDKWSSARRECNICTALRDQ